MPPVSSNLPHVGSRRPLLHPTKKEFKVGAPTFRVRTHRAVAEIPYIPDESEPARDIVGEIPEADALNTTRDANLQGYRAFAFRSSRLRLIHPTATDVTFRAPAAPCSPSARGARNLN